MKTLVEMLHNEMVRNGYFGVNGRDDQAIAGLIGAVQEWLGSDAVTALVEGGDLVRVGDLIREAGRGLGDVPAS